ncbi:MAG: hypothetical protein B7Z66_10480 [Chromatiales bacterium 21-64-14]|nr:MAG: hypothetical protein B7Z66_10480 [Chromatiales bacterium 21-64-14]HQU15775.1 TonB family protein [Gammaproteobacteria bacterium]
MQNMTLPPQVTSGDRLGLTLFVSVTVHALVILGIGFHGILSQAHEPLPRLDITLVQSRSPKAPDHPDYLAQANQDGGGNVTARVRPQNPLAGTSPVPLPGLAPANAAPSPGAPPAPRQRQVLTAPESERQVDSAPRRRPQPTAEAVDAHELVSRSLQIASLTAQVDQSLEAYARRPRQKFISARTQEYKYASYMEGWVAKVERMGNLNFPDQAARQALTGNLLLDVALRPDGSVEKITLLRSSGHPILDQAAIRIVKLCAPFAPFPPDIRKDTDILHITRTWEFRAGNQFSTR